MFHRYIPNAIQIFTLKLCIPDRTAKSNTILIVSVGPQDMQAVA